MPEPHPAPPAPQLDYLAHFQIDVGRPVEVGQTHAGRRRVIPILGGTVTGPWFSGDVLPGGADFQLLRSETVSELDARYVVRADTGDRLYVTNRAYRTGAPEDIAALARGESVPPELIYFRCAPWFEVAGDELSWLESTVVIGSGSRRPDKVLLDLWALR